MIWYTLVSLSLSVVVLSLLECFTSIINVAKIQVRAELF